VKHCGRGDGVLLMGATPVRGLGRGVRFVVKLGRPSILPATTRRRMDAWPPRSCLLLRWPATTQFATRDGTAATQRYVSVTPIASRRFLTVIRRSARWGGSPDAGAGSFP